ncbi:cytochrome P450 [Hyaloraphidium curvatum]|nr:cytochrome P450 [Hyaloraphidium curvatum]
MGLLAVLFAAAGALPAVLLAAGRACLLLAGVALAYALFLLLRSFAAHVYAAYIAPTKHIPGRAWTPFADLWAMVAGTGHERLAADHARLGPVVRLAPKVVSVIDPKEAFRILHAVDLPKARLYDMFVPPSMVPSVFSARDREYHRVRRRLLAPSFGLKHIAGREPQVMAVWDAFEAHVDGLVAAAEKGEAAVDACSESCNFASDVMGRAAFGMDFGTVGSAAKDPFLAAFNQAFDAVLYYYLVPASYTFYRLLPVAKAIDTVRGTGSRIVEERRALAKKDPAAAPRDLLEDLVRAHDAESGIRLTTEEVVAECTTVHFAGADTTGTTLTWVLYLLARHPRHADAVRREVAGVPSAGEKHIPHAELRNLPMLNAVINEALRLLPAGGGGASREVPPEGYELDVGGRKVPLPEGTEVIVHTWSMHRSPALWERADEFWPERWIGDEGSEASEAEGEIKGEGPRRCRRDAFLPFSAGSRDCIGKNFALQELRLFTVHFLRRYDFRLAGTGGEIRAAEEFLIVPEGRKLPLLVRRRAGGKDESGGK